jgi:hypothetical protein
MTERRKNLLAASLLILGVVLLCYGILRGEDTVVWRKAVNVCMECIGLG